MSPIKVSLVQGSTAWPTTAGAAISNYPAAAELPITVPHRTPGLWFVDPSRGRLELAGVNLGTVMVHVHDHSGDSVLSRALDLSGAANADVSRAMDTDLLLAELPPGRYRVVAESTDASGVLRGAELSATVRLASVSSERLAAALAAWAANRVAGQGGALQIAVASLGQ